ncbi:MAG: DHH family phosphoesterase [Clostridia bacterium]
MRTKPHIALIPLSIIAAVASAALVYFVKPIWIGAAMCILSAATFLFGIILLHVYSKANIAALDDVFRQNESVAGEIINKVNLPALIYNKSGHIIWSNQALDDMYAGHDIRKLMPGTDPSVITSKLNIEFNGRNFQVTSMPVERSHKNAQPLTFQYWMDRTEALHYSRLYEEQMPTVALIYVDNYEELNADKQFHKNAVLSEVEKLVSAFASTIEGIYRRYDTSKFFVVFEAKKLNELEKQRFPLLDSAREIDTGTNQTVTLSISVGVANRIALSDESARQGMELALGRGGDQAIVKRGASYSFFGGRQQVATKSSRVRARLFAKALRQLMENSDQVFVMGHKHADMDCVGAALGLMCCAVFAGCKAYMVLDEPNPMIENVFASMRNNPQYKDSIKTAEQAEQLLRAGSVVLVVDTQREGSVISPELYKQAGKTVVIDHHRRSVDALASPTLNYLEAGASSTCEMVTEVLQYFDDTMHPNGFESCALLAGITLDTKHFAFNTGARTFEAASYLRRNGADNSLVKLMFQDDMQTYRCRSDVVESAILMEKGIAISTCAIDMDNATLIAAQAADELISIKGIRASFVLAAERDIINISGRSLGDISVQLILERLGGGGHLTVAGAQLRDVSMDDAIAQLTESIHSYIKETET